MLQSLKRMNFFFHEGKNLHYVLLVLLLCFSIDSKFFQWKMGYQEKWHDPFLQ